MCCWRAPFSAEERATSVAFICLRITAAVAGPAEQALFIQRRRRRRYLGKGKLGQTLEPPHLICLLCPLFHRLSILILSLPPALPLSFSPTSAPRGRRIHDNSIPVRNEPAPSARPSVPGGRYKKAILSLQLGCAGEGAKERREGMGRGGAMAVQVAPL